MQASIREIIINEKLFFLCIVERSEFHNARMPELPDHIHILLEFLFSAGICILDSLHGNSAAIIKNCFVNCPKATFHKHFSRSPQFTSISAEARSKSSSSNCFLLSKDTSLLLSVPVVSSLSAPPLA